MAPPLPPGNADSTPIRKLSGIGATEEQVDMRDTVPQRNDRLGTKIEDLAGTGDGDSPGG